MHNRKTIEIVLVDDHDIVRQGLKALLTTIPGFEVVGEADNGLQAVRCILELKPDLVFLDISLPKMNGIGVLIEIKKQYPPVKFIVLTAHNSNAYVHACFAAGAEGFISKATGFDEIEFAARTVIMGKTFIGPEISAGIIEGYLAGQKPDAVKTKLDSLTKREKEILKLIAQGHKNKEIARDLDISPKTVVRHRENLMKKMNLHNASALTAFAMQNQVV